MRPSGVRLAWPSNWVVVAELADVRAVGVHHEQVSHQVALAGDVLRLAGRAESNLAVGQVDGLDVGHAGREGELRDLAGGEIHLVDVVVVGNVAAHGEDDLLAVEVHVGLAGDALGHVEQRRRLAGRRVEELDGAAALEAAGVDLARLVHRRLGAVLVPILRADHEEDGVGDGRARAQRATKGNNEGRQDPRGRCHRDFQ